MASEEFDQPRHMQGKPAPEAPEQVDFREKWNTRSREVMFRTIDGGIVDGNFMYRPGNAPHTRTQS